MKKIKNNIFQLPVHIQPFDTKIVGHSIGVSIQCEFIIELDSSFNPVNTESGFELSHMFIKQFESDTMPTVYLVVYYKDIQKLPWFRSREVTRLHIVEIRGPYMIDDLGGQLPMDIRNKEISKIRLISINDEFHLKQLKTRLEGVDAYYYLK